MLKPGRSIASGISLVLLAVLAAGTWSPASAGAAESGREAAEILSGAGVGGGLVVHLGCGEAHLTAALHHNDSYLVQGLEADPAKVEAAAGYIRSLGLYGPVTVTLWQGPALPYVDNLVNLVVAEDSVAVSPQEMLRVLAPGGVAYVRKQGQWTRTIKPRASSLDQWTHFLHGPDGNAVSTDTTVAPPARLQWVGSPQWARSHEHLSSVSATVCAGGRLFAIVDEGPKASITLPANWSLTARDAFSGVVLWKRPIVAWQTHLHGFRDGPPELPRRLVAVDDRVYVTLSMDAPLTALDAATGKTLMTYDAAPHTQEVIYCRGLLLAVVGAGRAGAQAQAARRGQDAPPLTQDVVAIAAADGRPAWRKKVQDLRPLTLTADDKRVLYKDGAQIVCLALTDGKELWRSPVEENVLPQQWYAPTLVLRPEAVLFGDGKTLTALSAQTGKPLWTDRSYVAFNSSPDVLVIGGIVWTGETSRAASPGFIRGLDILTGKVVRQFEPDKDFGKVGMPHHRCYRDKATERYILAGKAGVEYVDLKTGSVQLHHWVRGACQYGIVPANGLLYAPSHSCVCYIKAKLSGFYALAPEGAPDEAAPATPDDRLHRGPAWDKVPETAAATGDWPTYRQDARRGGAATSALAARLAPAWRAQVGGRLSSPVAAQGRVFVSAIDAHAVCALDARTGKKLWQRTVGGRVDSPPTIWQGRAIFGCADGWVYCLRAEDGELVWRFLAAPRDRRVVAWEQVESVWPVPGSVLVCDDTAYFAAGRSSFLDGGIVLYGLDARTGQQKFRTVLYSPRGQNHKQPPVTSMFDIDGALPDVLSDDGGSIYMRHLRFSRRLEQQDAPRAHLFCPTGFLDDAWWHRSYWLYGSRFPSGWGGWMQSGNRVPSGRLMVMDDKAIYGFGRKVYGNILPARAGHWSQVEQYQLFASDRPAPTQAAPTATPAARPSGKPAAKRGQGQAPQAPQKTYRWNIACDIQPRAMLLAGPALFIAGPAGDFRNSLEAYQGKQGVKLQVRSTDDGKLQVQYDLESLPVFDGMAAAEGRLFVTLANGVVVCLAQDAAAAAGR